MEIDITTIVFKFFGGLAIFLYGMNLMSDGLKNLGGSKLGDILQAATKSRFRSIMVGTGITCFIQSSSATSVMVVGFLNAGLLSLTQAIAVVLGADIGTTFTAWMVSLMGKFKISAYALPVIAIGFLINMLAKSKKKKMYGLCILGFGFLFLGLGTISSGMGPLKESQMVIDLFAQFGDSPLLGVLCGLVVTMILQSSSATIAIVQTLALNGVVGLDGSLALMLGCGIGTTITAHLAAITGTRASRTMAVSNTVFKIIGTLIFLPFIYNGWFADLIRLFMADSTGVNATGQVIQESAMTQIAIANTLFNVVVVTFFASIVWKPFVAISKRLTYGKKDELERRAKYLDPLFLTDPAIAMKQAILELIRMTELAKDTVLDTKRAIFNKDVSKLDKIRDKEEIIDELQGAITSYLIKISENDLDSRISGEYPILLHCVNDIEKIGDYAMNLVKYVEIMAEKKTFTPETDLHTVDAMFVKVEAMLTHVIESLKMQSTYAAKMALQVEEDINEMKRSCKAKYIERLNSRQGDPEIEMINMDIASNLEKMGDHLTSVAVAVINDLHWDAELTSPIIEPDQDLPIS